MVVAAHPLQATFRVVFAPDPPDLPVHSRGYGSHAIVEFATELAINVFVDRVGLVGFFLHFPLAVVFEADVVGARERVRGIAAVGVDHRLEQFVGVDIGVRPDAINVMGLLVAGLRVALGAGD